MFDRARIAEIVNAGSSKPSSEQLLKLLTNQDFLRIYEHICDNPGCLQSALGKKLGVDRSRTRSYVQRAVQLKVVRREHTGSTYKLFDALLDVQQQSTAMQMRALGPPLQLSVGCFLDTETTGLDPAKHELIELAIILFEFNHASGEILRIIEEYVGQRYPNRSIPQAATWVHGIAKRDLIGKQIDCQHVESMLLRAEVIVAHNAEFDRGFLEPLFPTCGAKVWKCSMSDIDWHGHGFRSRKLQNLLRRHKIRPETAHRALADARAALELLSKTGANGRTYFAELLSGAPTLARSARTARLLREKPKAESIPDTSSSAARSSPPTPLSKQKGDTESWGGKEVAWIIALAATLILLAFWALTR